jgi:hypothetical protein
VLCHYIRSYDLLHRSFEVLLCLQLLHR